MGRERRRYGVPAHRRRALLLTGPLAIAGAIAGAWGGSMLASHPTVSGEGATTVVATASRVQRDGHAGTPLAVRVRLTSWLQMQLGQASIDVVLPRGADVGALLDRLSAEYPVIAAMGSSAMIAVSGSMASPDTVLVEGETVELMPAMAGG